MATECSECGSVLGEFERMCGECATPVPGVKQKVAKLICTACATSLPKESAFCLACGEPIAEASEET